MQKRKILALAIAALAIQACASTGATFRSGVGDTYLEHPPYYAGTAMAAVARDSGALGHLPVAFQAGANQPASFDPPTGPGSAIATLLADMNAWLDSLGISRRLVDGGRVSAVAHSATRYAPDVRFGCIPDRGIEDCSERGDSALGRGSQQMLLTVGRPSAEWTQWIADVTREQGVARTLVITLEIGDYLLRQQGFVGRKVLELGTGNTARLPWLTSVETPVSVLQLTAALVERDGKVVRIGAEGFYARRTRLLVSSLGGQELIGEEDIRAARELQRDDLPGAPLAWKTALRELVERITGRAVSSTALAPNG